MTEITTTTVVATETVAPRVQRRALAGILSNIARTEVEGSVIVLASLTTSFKGSETTRTLSISGDALVAVEDLLVEGGFARFYAELGESYCTVIGPDLTKRTLAREAAKAEPVETVAAAPAPKKAKREMSEAQKLAWNTIILPKMMEGRARKAAERAAAQAAEPVAA